jgi:hypothetical protein
VHQNLRGCNSEENCLKIFLSLLSDEDINVLIDEKYYKLLEDVVNMLEYFEKKRDEEHYSTFGDRQLFKWG